MGKLIKSLQRASSLLLCLLCLSCAGQPGREGWIQHSSLVFKAELLLLNTSTVDWKDPSDLGVVLVQEIFQGDQPLTGFLNDKITVKFRSKERPKPGQVLIIYGNVWLMNEGLAVTETGYEVLGENNLTKENYKDEIKKSMRNADMSTIREKASRSELVLTGKVTSIRKNQENRAAESEHDPQWVVAEIMVEEGLKGDKKAGTQVTVAFPGSQDIMWIRSPRLKEGMSAIFFLSREDKGFRDLKHYPLTAADEVRDMRDIELVRQALR